MTTSEQIRALAGQGVPTAEIARTLGIRYQYAYRVLKRDSAAPAVPSRRATLPQS